MMAVLTHLSMRCWPSSLRLVWLSTSLGQGVTLLRQSSTPRVSPLMVRELPIPGHETTIMTPHTSYYHY